MRSEEKLTKDYNEDVEWDKQHLWHPYTQHKEYSFCPPVYIVRAKGIYLYDIHGRVYYDTISSWWCNILGHGRKDLVKALSKQATMLDHTLFAGVIHKLAVDLTREMREILPSHLSRFFFSDNGSTAIEVAIKMAFQYWRMKKQNRDIFLFLMNGYHGDTIGAMSVSGVSQFNSYFKDLFFRAKAVPSPSENWRKALQGIESIVERYEERVCAILIEPLVQCAGGMRIYPSEFLDGLERLRRKYKFFVICDEIAVGMGRLGRFLAHQGTSLKPDFVCLSKALTNGMLPLALTITTEQIFNAFLGDYSTHTFFHGHTYTANPIACRVAVETLRLLKKGPYMEWVKKIECRLKGFAKEVERRVSRVKNSDAIGVIWRAEVEKATRAEMLSLYTEGLRRGIILRPLANVIYLFLPLVVKRKELEDILERTMDTIKSVG